MLLLIHTWPYSNVLQLGLYKDVITHRVLYRKKKKILSNNFAKSKQKM